MNGFPEVRDPGSIKLLFSNIRSKDIPDKMTTHYLASIGFRRQTDVKLLELLFFLGFIDNNLAPTDLWRDIKDVSEEKFKETLSGAIKNSYTAVFDYESEIGSADSKVLIEFFKRETGTSETDCAYMLLTMQVLLNLVDLTSTAMIEEKEPVVPTSETKQAEVLPTDVRPDVPDEPAPGTSTAVYSSGGVSLNIVIPPEAMDAELTEIIKKLLRKSL